MFYMERDFKKIITYTLEDNIGEVGQKGNRSIRLYYELEIAETRIAHKTMRTPGFFHSFLFFFFLLKIGWRPNREYRKKIKMFTEQRRKDFLSNKQCLY